MENYSLGCVCCFLFGVVVAWLFFQKSNYGGFTSTGECNSKSDVDEIIQLSMWNTVCSNCTNICSTNPTLKSYCFQQANSNFNVNC